MNRRDLFRCLPAALASRVLGSAKPTERKPIPTGFREFDDLTGGLPPGSLTVLVGNSESGRTTLAMNVSEHVALNESRPVLYLIQTDSKESFSRQIACSRARVDWLDCAEGQLTLEEEDQFERAKKDLGSSALLIDDTPELEDAEIVERITVWAREHPFGLAVVDHVAHNTFRTMARCSQALKSVAVRTGAAVLATRWRDMFQEGHEAGPDAECDESGVGRSHADYTWNLYRPWCHRGDLHPREEARLNIIDWRTKEHRLALELRLDEELRRFSVVGMNECCPSLRLRRECNMCF